MSPKSRSSKAVVKTILSCVGIRVANRTHHGLASSFIHDVDAVSSTVASRNALGLTIEAQVQASEITKLTHRVLKTTKSSTSPRTHWNCALNTTVKISVWRKSRRLERQNLIRRKLLLVESLLLLLQGINLILKSNLSMVMVNGVKSKSKSGLPVLP